MYQCLLFVPWFFPIQCYLLVTFFCIHRLKDCMGSEATGFLVLDTLKSLSNLRSIRHQYSKIVAQVSLLNIFIHTVDVDHDCLNYLTR